MAHKCRSCGKYVDCFEWPQEVREQYKPNLCYACYLEKMKQEAEEAEEPEQDNEFGEPPAEIDPELDDVPDPSALEQDTADDEAEVTNEDEEQDTPSDEESSIQGIRRLLFG